MIKNIKREFVSYGNESTYKDDKKQIFDYLSILKHTTNQLVDAVNELKTKVEIVEEHLHPTAKTDQYAEQRKWMWHLCRFWFDNKKQADIGILGGIYEDDCHPYWNIDLGYNYKHCEPVKPDDDIIYKGGDNE